MDKSLYVYVKLIDAGFSVETFNNGKQFNVRDKNGIIQSFYTSGTIVAHDANNKIYSIREKTVVDLLNYAIKAIQELSAKVDEQEKRIKELERN